MKYVLSLAGTRGEAADICNSGLCGIRPCNAKTKRSSVRESKTLACIHGWGARRISVPPPTNMKVTVGGALDELEAIAAVEVRVVGPEPTMPPRNRLLCKCGTPVTSSCRLNHCNVSNCRGRTSQIRPAESKRKTASCATAKLRTGASVGHSVAIASSTVSFSQPGVKTTVQMVPPTFLASIATDKEPKGQPGGVSVICGTGKSGMGGCKNCAHMVASAHEAMASLR